MCFLRNSGVNTKNAGTLSKTTTDPEDAEGRTRRGSNNSPLIRFGAETDEGPFRARDRLEPGGPVKM